MSTSSNFQSKGYHVVKGLLRPEEVKTYREAINQVFGISDQYFDPSKKSNDKTFADGFSKTPGLWSVLKNPELHKQLESILGKGYKFLQHTDIHAGFSAGGWHRDSVDRVFGPGIDWEEVKSKYRVVRVGFYLQKFSESGFKLGFVPGSHQKSSVFGGNGFFAKLMKKVEDFFVNSFKLNSFTFPFIISTKHIALENGDCVIFDPRAIHKGSRIKGPKYSFFIAFGIPDEHYWHHTNYYRKTRKDLGYTAWSPAFVSYLQELGLYAEESVK